MEEYAAVRKLVEIMFEMQFTDIAEIEPPNSSLLPCLLTRDFTRILQKVLFYKQFIVCRRWQAFFDTCCYRIFTSHTVYLTYIIRACSIEYSCYQNVFEGFISMCAVLANLSNETLAKTGMNFCVLNPDIIMEYYDTVIKSIFRKSGGFQQLVEHIRGHRYLAWDTPADPTTDNSDGTKKLGEEILKESVGIFRFDSDEFANDFISVNLAKEVLRTTKAELPVLLSKFELVQKLVTHRQNQIVKTSEVKGGIEAAAKLEPLEETNQACTNSNFETNHLPKQKEDIAWYESIILAVKRCNHSISSGLVNSDNSIQNNTDRILEHLKHTIESLIEVLDEYD